MSSRKRTRVRQAASTSSIMVSVLSELDGIFFLVKIGGVYTKTISCKTQTLFTFHEVF